MNCKTIRDQLPDVALASAVAPPEVEAHLAGCPECAHTLKSLRATMSLLDEWKAPEPSPYWDVRMQARLREEQQKTAVPHGWLYWLRRPALSLTAALFLVLGVGSYQAFHFLNESSSAPALPERMASAPVATGTAVADLQYLEKNSDLLQNFDALDDLDGDDDAGSN
jgi:anti-sigma factor RsiW